MRPYFENKNQKIFTSYKNKSYSYPSHFHNHLEVVYCFSGIQNVKVGEKIYILKNVTITCFNYHLSFFCLNCKVKLSNFVITG